MTRLFTEGFEDQYYAQQPWLVSNNPSNMSSTPGRLGGYGLFIRLFNSIQANLSNNPTTVYMRAAVKCMACCQGIAETKFISGSGLEIYLTTIGGDVCRVYGYNAGQYTQLFAGKTVLQTWTWYLVELRYTIDATNGYIELRVEGIPDGSIGPVPTNYRGGSNIQAINWGIGNENFAIDDVAVNDDGGSAPDNTWVGDSHVVKLYPNADISTQWTPSSGTVNYAMVDELVPDDESSYVTTLTSGNTDWYSAGSVTLQNTDTVKRVWASTIARLESADGSELNIGLRVGNTGTANWAGTALTSIYTPYAGSVLTLTPDGAAWSNTNINNVQVGLQIP